MPKPAPLERLSPFQQRIRRLSEERGVEVSQLGKQAGLSDQAALNWLRKGALPRVLQKWRQFATRWDVSIDWLVGEEPIRSGSPIPRFGASEHAAESEPGATVPPISDLNLERYRKQLREIASRLGLREELVLLLELKRDVPEEMAAADIPSQVKIAIVAAAQVTGHPLEKVAEIAAALSEDQSLRNHRHAHTVELWFDEIRKELSKLPPPGSGLRTKVTMPPPSQGTDKKR